MFYNEITNKKEPVSDPVYTPLERNYFNVTLPKNYNSSTVEAVGTLTIIMGIITSILMATGG